MRGNSYFELGFLALVNVFSFWFLLNHVSDWAFFFLPYRRTYLVQLCPWFIVMAVIYHCSVTLSSLSPPVSYWLIKATEEEVVREGKLVFASDSLLNIYCRVQDSGSQLCAFESPGDHLKHANGWAPLPGISWIWIGYVVWFGDLTLVFFPKLAKGSDVQTKLKTTVSKRV